MLWNPLSHLLQKIRAEGGFVNAHAHFDRAYSVTPMDFENVHGNVNSHLHEKWKLVDAFKSKASEEDYFNHITAALRSQKEQGVQIAMSFIDSDPVAELRALRASERAKEYAGKELHMRFLTACQTLKGVLSKESRDWFEEALPFVDVIGGLPGADRGREKEHLDVLLRAAKQTKKRLHVHVDQLNCASEKETELLCRQIVEHGMEGKVTAVHGISIAAHPQAYRNEVYRMCLDAGLSFVACPTAWIDARRNETLAPTHNAVTPIDEMIPLGIVVALGSDNICDIYKPFANGDMTVELRTLLESTHFYDSAALVKVAVHNGRKVLGLD
jgi:cytosine/creatinine deaminase